ncbi:MAG: response regulator transcription factor [Cyclobacteriaceae bacterium]|nr:response regulator transcription factor [Cyclobacteriaceae bacterium]
MKVLIVEDEKLAAERLQEMIKQYDTNISIAGPFDTVQETSQYLAQHNDIDVLFLDIQLADGKSFELFDQTPYFKPVIFTTAYDHYSIKAFKYNSIDYLLKPVRFEELTFALNKFKRLNPADRSGGLTKEIVRELLQANTYKKRFLVKQGSRIQYIPVEAITYLFADGKITYLVSNERKQFIVDHTLEELESELLDPSFFFRISRKAIVRIDAIQEVRTNDNRLELNLSKTADFPLVVSRDRLKAFKDWLNH